MDYLEIIGNIVVFATGLPQESVSAGFSLI